jgi:ATP-binding cassette subfamily B protein
MPEGTVVHESLKGSVRFEEVWFAYKEEDYVLKGINLDIKPGETVALVGSTGAGKSTIIGLLNRFYETSKGKIVIDGQDIRDFNLSFLRKNIGVVLQDVFLFSDSIRNNITLNNPDVTDDMILHAAEMVGARKFIEKLPGGLNYNVMERGSTLSVGQRQLISFIRAMVYDPKILVLDEATSSVDHETEEMIQQAIGKMMSNRTSIVIAHRLSTIQKADRIIVLEKGMITESGTHRELINLNGRYAAMHSIQYRDIS